MSLSLDDVKRIALLARVAVSEKEAADARDQLNSIFGLIEQLRAANTDGIAPMSHAQEVFQRLRPDEVTEADRHATYQKAAQQVEADLYLVPKVIE